MGIDKKPRLRNNSYVETVRSESSVIQENEFSHQEELLMEMEKAMRRK